MLRLQSASFIYAIALMFALVASSMRAQELDQRYAQAHHVLHGFIEKMHMGAAAADAYLLLDDVKGSATEAGHAGQIPVLFARYAIISSGGPVGTGIGKATASDYFLAIPVDQASPELLQAAASGKPYKKAQIFFRRSDSGHLGAFAQDTLEDIRISFYERSATAIDGYPEVVIIGLQYAKVTWSVGSAKAGRDFASNKNL